MVDEIGMFCVPDITISQCLYGPCYSLVLSPLTFGNYCHHLVECTFSRWSKFDMLNSFMHLLTIEGWVAKLRSQVKFEVNKLVNI